MRKFILQRPYAFSLLLCAALLALIYASRLPFPSIVVGDVGDLDPGQVRQPTQLERAVSSVHNAETLYLALALLLAILLTFVLGMSREVGFNKPVPPKNLLLAWFPLLVVALTLYGGVRFPEAIFFVTLLLAVSLEVLSNELLFRGVMWRVLAPAGLFQAVIITSLLSGGTMLARTLTSGPWPEAVYLTLTAACGGFTFAAIRWRTASLWPTIFLNFALALSIDLAVVRMSIFPYLLLATTVGFTCYGLFLLRNRRVREDGGISGQEPARVS